MALQAGGRSGGQVAPNAICAKTRQSAQVEGQSDGSHPYRLPRRRAHPHWSVVATRPTAGKPNPSCVHCGLFARKPRAKTARSLKAGAAALKRGVTNARSLRTMLARLRAQTEGAIPCQIPPNARFSPAAV